MSSRIIYRIIASHPSILLTSASKGFTVYVSACLRCGRYSFSDYQNFIVQPIPRSYYRDQSRCHANSGRARQRKIRGQDEGQAPWHPNTSERCEGLNTVWLRILKTDSSRTWLRKIRCRQQQAHGLCLEASYPEMRVSFRCFAALAPSFWGTRI